MEQTETALDVIVDHFGHNVTQVARYLVESRTPCTLQSVLDSGIVDHEASLLSLGVLFQHNLLLLRLEEEVGVVLELSVIRACLRLVHTHFLRVAKMRFGSSGVTLTRLFLEHGRLTEHAMHAQLAAQNPQASTTEPKTYQQTFHAMLSGVERYIVPCSSVSFTSEGTIKDLSIFSGNDPDDISLETQWGDRDTGALTHKPMTTDNLPSNQVQGITLYRLNVFQFLYTLRCETLLTHLSTLFMDQPDVFEVLREILRADASKIEHSETAYALSPFSNQTTPISLRTLSRAVPGKTLPEVDHLLQSLSSAVTGSYLMELENKGKVEKIYTLNARKVLDEMRTEKTESILIKRFNREGLRIFRLLTRHKFLEDMTISNLAKIAPETVRRHLFGLLQAGFVRTQVVPAPPKEFILWGLTQNTGMRRLIEGTYRTLRILINRLQLPQQNPNSTQSAESFLNENMKMTVAHSIIDIADMLLLLEIY